MEEDAFGHVCICNTVLPSYRPWLSEGVKSLQRGRKISAWRGHEDSGGEGQLGREPGRPGGDQFFPWEDLCKLLFVWILLSLSLVKVLVKVKFSLAPLVFVQYATACDQGLSAETCNASWKYIQRKNEGCLLLIVYTEIWGKIRTSWLALSS